MRKRAEQIDQSNEIEALQKQLNEMKTRLQCAENREAELNKVKSDFDDYREQAESDIRGLVRACAEMKCSSEMDSDSNHRLTDEKRNLVKTIILLTKKNTELEEKIQEQEMIIEIRRDGNFNQRVQKKYDKISQSYPRYYAEHANDYP